MNLTNVAVVSIMGVLMIGCGGGGSSSPSTAVDPIVSTIDESVDETTEIEVEELDPNAIYESTAELVVSKAFLIEQEYELAVSYKNKDNRRAYLSVCSEFTEGLEGINVNYNSCLLRTSIEADFADTLKVGNDKNRLVMAIWFLDDTENPRYEVWQNNSEAEGLRRFDVN